MTLEVNGHSFVYELSCVVRLFFPDVKLETGRIDSDGDAVMASIITDENKKLAIVFIRLGKFQEEASQHLPLDIGKEEQERVLAVLLFRLLSMHTGACPPWGVLTGVRPLRLCRLLREKGFSNREIYVRLLEGYLVQPEKAALALETGSWQEAILADNHKRDFSLYISIPFCPSRCLYCSFVSHEIEKCVRLIPDYLRLLARELRQIAELARKLNMRLRTIYIGGGTPTILEAVELERLLAVIRDNFDCGDLLEYTVEAGRPDTITPEKLAVLRKYGADRVSINPQTMDDSILAAIGRKHTAAMTEDAFRMARDMGFSRINMDIIAGLPGDGGASLLNSIDRVLAMSPENITVHSLTVKRSSALRGQEGAYVVLPKLEAALSAAHGKLRENGYHPFYLYRQKGTRQNLENVGFARPGFDSPYNIFIMEEVQTILSAGAGAVTKLCAPGRIERVYNFKFPYEYINRFGELAERKKGILEFYQRKQG